MRLRRDEVAGQDDSRADYGHAQAEQDRRRSERQGAAVLAGLGNLARLEALGLDVTAQRTALGLDGKGCGERDDEVPRRTSTPGVIVGGVQWEFSGHPGAVRARR